MTKIPEEFCKVMKDFIKDVKTTFPEYSPLINKWWKDSSSFDYIEEEEERNKAIENSEKTSMRILFEFAQKKYPSNFFEILYQNNDIFKENTNVDTEFLPYIHFKDLWQFDLTDKTRETIWKYLQLILFSIINTIQDKSAFGDTAKLFEAINETDFKTKLEETLDKMQDIFNISQSNDETDISNLGSTFNVNDLPNAEDLHSHITGMLDGKLGKLAKEIAEETAENLNMDMDNVSDMKDVFNKLIKNPGKLMGLVKNVGDKLETKIKSGEIKESELIAEATEIMNRMKNMPGMDGIQSMLSKMGMNGSLAKGAKINYGAMEAKLNQQMKNAKTAERMKAKVELNKLMKETQANLQKAQEDIKPQITEEELIAIFNTGDKPDKTPRGIQPPKQGKKKNKSKK
jgi:hypothetical protein